MGLFSSRPEKRAKDPLLENLENNYSQRNSTYFRKRYLNIKILAYYSHTLPPRTLLTAEELLNTCHGKIGHII